MINGTVGLEAAIQYMPVFVFGLALYSAAKCFFKPKDFDDFFKQLREVRSGNFHFDEATLCAIL